MQAESLKSSEREFLPSADAGDQLLRGVPGGQALINAQRQAVSVLGTLADLTGNEELWRYTKPELFPWAWLRGAEPSSVQLQPVQLQPAQMQTDPGEKLPDGFIVIERSDASASALAEKILGELAGDLSDNVAALYQLALSKSLHVVSVNGSSKQPVRLSHLLSGLSESKGVESKAWTPLIIISVASGSDVLLVEDLQAAIGEGFYAPRLEILVERNARCQFVSCQRLPGSATYFARHRFHLLRDAQLTTVHAALGGKVSRVDLDCKLYEPGANADLFNVSLTRGEQHSDFHPTQAHLAPHCRSNLYSKGVLTDKARSVYFGFIRVAEEAQKTDAYQTSRNILLSPDARADAIPNLEIRANDVKCSHGASVSKVGADELFYLMTRGISRGEAERLLVQGFLEDLVQNISNQWVKDFVVQALNQRLATV